ncbi:MAG: hypothetical protein WA972_05680 [Rhodococcus qingshengii]
MTLVTFNRDLASYCKGDTVRLSDEELTLVDKAIERRELTDAYEVVEGAADAAPKTTSPETEAPVEMPVVTDAPVETAAPVETEAPKTKKGGK